MSPLMPGCGAEAAPYQDFHSVLVPQSLPRVLPELPRLSCLLVVLGCGARSAQAGGGPMQAETDPPPAPSQTAGS